MAVIGQELEDGTVFFVRFDATVQETHSSAVDITDHAVERGSNVVDHVRPQPLRVALTVRVSNTPITAYGTKQNPFFRLRENSIELHSQEGTFGPEEISYQSSGVKLFGPVAFGAGRRTQTVTVLRFDTPVERVQAIHAELVSWQREGVLLNVYTSLRDYRDMLVETVDAPRDAGSGNAVDITLQIKQVRVVSSEEVPLPEDERGNTQRNRGAKATKQPTPAEETKVRTSLLSDAASFGGL